MIEPFNYILDKSKIADRPVRPYDSAKLLLLDTTRQELKESVFSKLHEEFSGNEVLVFNNTKVNPARLFGKIKDRQKEAEFLLLKQVSEDSWHALARPVKNLKEGTQVVFEKGLIAEIRQRISDQVLEVTFKSEESDLKTALDLNLLMPIPPYIRQGHADSEDEKDYQTIFAEHAGSIAAPTASLHFTESLVDNIRKKDVITEFLTLHVGIASVRPLWDNNDPAAMRAPGEELFIADTGLKQRLLSYKKNGKKIVAVGTTVVRALESLFLPEKSYKDGELVPTDLFIRPGFEFKIIDALITNFHFPASSHLLLVQALMGEMMLKKSYNYALENNFRFLSYGDGMYIK